MHSKGDHKQNDSLPDWQKMFVNHLTDKGLISKIHKQLFKLNIKKSKQPNQNIGTRSKYTFLQRRHTDGKHMKRRSTSFIIREMQIKTTMRYHLMAVRMAAVKKSRNNKCWRRCREKGTILYCWWECKLVQPLWRIMWKFLKKLEIELPYYPAIPLLGIHTEETRIKRDPCTPTFITSTVCNSQGMEAT